MYSAVDVAVAILKTAQEKGFTLTQMQVQKLVYVAHGLSLAQRDLPLIKEHINAWQYGPVIPEIYARFKAYASSEIRVEELPEFKSNQDLDLETQRILNDVVDNFARLSGGQLSELSHRSGSPWHNVWFDRKGQVIRGAVIPNELIKPHYQHILQTGVVECL